MSLHSASGSRLEIKRLLDAALKSHFAVHEDSPELQRLADSAPRVTLFVEQVISALQDLQSRYEHGEDDQKHKVENLETIGDLISAEVAGQEIADLAFIAVMNLREVADRLARRADVGRHTEIVALCDAVMHRVRRTLVPLEAALCRIEGLQAPHRLPHYLKISLHTRRLYTKLRRDIVCEKVEPADEELENSLANSAQHFRLLRASSVYPHLRLDDRLQMRGLCQRIGQWLQSGSRRKRAEGLNLWQDTVAFLRLLAGVNCREEIEVHDFEVASQALCALESTPPDHEIPSGVRDDLQGLLGRNDEIDSLLLERSPPTTETWSSALQRLCRDLHHVAQGSNLE